MSKIITISPSPSLFGFGALEKLPESLRSRGFKRVLIFTDSQIAKSGILQRVLDLLKGSIELEIFDGVPAEPRSSDMDKKKEDGEEFLKKTLVRTRRIMTNPRPLDDELFSYIEEGI